MIDWGTLETARSWPIAVALVAVLALAAVWRYRPGETFPDVLLLERARGRFAFAERLVPVIGVLLLILFAVAMTGPSVVRVDRVEQRARDFFVLVDTSRSMRHDTGVRRSSATLHFERRVGAFLEAVGDPDAMPYVARFELARESLYRFLADRDADDRVALVYFNDDVYPVSALTSDAAFLTEQLASMDDYVNWGTDIAAALGSAMRLLERYPGDNRRSVILLTDAETRFSEDLDEQFANLADAGLSLHLLWITVEDPELASNDARNFLQLAAEVGSVHTIRDPDAVNLADALDAIGLSESYGYQELRRQTIDLGTPILDIARVLLLAWLCLVTTIRHPLMRRQPFVEATR